MNLFDLTGRKAIVTGGTRGLGHGMAEGLMEAGAEVVIFGSSETVHDVATQFCDRGFKCHGLAVDLGEEFPLSDWEAVMNVNLTAPFELCQMAAREFMAKEKPGKIINISSMLAFFGGFTVPAYAASKGAVTQMTKAFCNEWASRNINVNCIAPGYMDTEMNTALTDPSNPRYAEITNRIPAHRWGTPEDMKGAVIFLASPASDYLNGAVIPVDGGYLVK